MTDPQKSNQTQQGIISNGIAQQSGGSGGIRLYWLINETPSDGGPSFPLPHPLSLSLPLLRETKYYSNLLILYEGPTRALSLLVFDL